MTGSITCTRCNTANPAGEPVCLRCWALLPQGARNPLRDSGIPIPAASPLSHAVMPGPVSPFATPQPVESRDTVLGTIPTTQPEPPSRIRPASIRTRLAASVLDQIVAATVVLYPLYLAFDGDDDWGTVLLLVCGLLYVVGGVLVLAATGRTPAKWIFGLRVMGGGRGRPLTAPGVRGALLRSITLALANVVLFLGAASVLFDRNGFRRGFHDKAGRTVVLDVRHGLDPLRTTTRPTDDRQARFTRPARDAFRRAMTPEMPPADERRRPLRSGSPHLASPDRRRDEPARSMPIAQRLPTRVLAAASTGVRATLDRTDRRPDAPVWEIVFDNGTRIAVTGTGLVGRDPAATDGEQVTHLVAIADETMSLSKTHLEFAVGPLGFWVRDRASTNGSELEIAGKRTRLAPRVRTSVPAGARVFMGARSFEVHR